MGDEYTITASDTASEGTLYYLCTIKAAGREFTSNVKKVTVTASTSVTPPVVPSAAALGDDIEVALLLDRDEAWNQFTRNENRYLGISVTPTIRDTKKGVYYKAEIDVIGKLYVDGEPAQEVVWKMDDHTFYSFEGTDGDYTHTGYVGGTGNPWVSGDSINGLLNYCNMDAGRGELVFDKVEVTVTPWKPGSGTSSALTDLAVSKTYDLGERAFTYHIIDVATVQTKDPTLSSCSAEERKGWPEDHYAEISTKYPGNGVLYHEWNEISAPNDKDKPIVSGDGQYYLGGMLWKRYSNGMKVMSNLLGDQAGNQWWFNLREDLVDGMENWQLLEAEGQWCWGYVPSGTTTNTMYVYAYRGRVNVIQDSGNE